MKEMKKYWNGAIIGKHFSCGTLGYHAELVRKPEEEHTVYLKFNYTLDDDPKDYTVTHIVVDNNYNVLETYTYPVRY